jgi:hypothetical protein
MLQRLGDHIKACLSRAETCKSTANKTADPEVRKQLTELGQQWEHVAKSYEFIESLERFLLDQQKNALPHDVEKLPKDGPEM